MAYATLTDLNTRYGQDAILVLADRDNDGTADPEVIAGALEYAEAEVDAWLSGRYDLPLVDVPPVIVGIVCDIAAYRMCNTDALVTEERRKRFEDAMSTLKAINSGRMKLGKQPEPQSSQGAVFISGKPRVHGRGSGGGLK